MRTRPLLAFLLIPATAEVQDLARRAPSIPLEEFARRRAEILKRLQGPVVVHAGPARERKIAWPMEASVEEGLSFFYLTGRLDPEAVLALDPESGRATLFSNQDAERIARETGIEDVRPLDRLADRLKELAARGPIHTESRRRVAALLPENSAVETRKLTRAMVSLRARKSEAEIAQIGHACDVTAVALRRAMAATRPGCNEADLARVIEETYGEFGCKFAFASIVGGSKNTPVIHYTANNQPLEDGDLVLVDVGASWNGYACDFSRTWPVNGRFSEKQRRAYQAVLKAQKAAEELLRPGATWKDLALAAARALDEAGFRRTSFLQYHTIGHYVGLQPHDVGFRGLPFEPGVVIMIEPGVYDPKEKISVRLEDLYVVTQSGFLRLTDGCPRELEEVEALVGPRPGDEY